MADIPISQVPNALQPLPPPPLATVPNYLVDLSTVQRNLTSPTLSLDAFNGQSDGLNALAQGFGTVARDLGHIALAQARAQDLDALAQTSNASQQIAQRFAQGALTANAAQALQTGLREKFRRDPESFDDHVSVNTWLQKQSDAQQVIESAMQRRALGPYTYRPGKAPQLITHDEYGSVTAKFDGVIDEFLIDRKRAIVTTERTRHEALRQSATAAKNGYRIRWEVPNASEAEKARKLFDELGIRNIDILIVQE